MILDKPYPIHNPGSPICHVKPNVYEAGKPTNTMQNMLAIDAAPCLPVPLMIPPSEHYIHAQKNAPAKWNNDMLAIFWTLLSAP